MQRDLQRLEGHVIQEFIYNGFREIKESFSIVAGFTYILLMQSNTLFFSRNHSKNKLFESEIIITSISFLLVFKYSSNSFIPGTN